MPGVRISEKLSESAIVTLTLFAHRFVRREFRERFLHEAARKPARLHSRICHGIDRVFDDEYRCLDRRQPAFFQAHDPCLFFSGRFESVTWAEARAEMDRGGGGYLVIKRDGSAFHAETEGEPPDRIYAGSRIL
jgi:hypothetical protein